MSLYFSEHGSLKLWRGTQLAFSDGPKPGGLHVYVFRKIKK